MGGKKGAAKDAEKKAALKAAKAAAAQKKAERRSQKEASKKKRVDKSSSRTAESDEEEEEEDIDTLLAQFAKAEVTHEQVKIENCADQKPPFRAHASLGWSFQGDEEAKLLLFGGESFDGRKCYCYRDLYLFDLTSRLWQRVKSQNAPAPRSSHQWVSLCHPTTKERSLYLFGGEFVSPHETQFYHHRDFWALHQHTLTWRKIDIKTPPGRSGHRMVAYKDRLVLFGGFSDAGIVTKYLDDLWVFDPLKEQWCKVEDPLHIHPAPRSGFAMWTVGKKVFVYGGTSREKVKGVKEPKTTIFNDLWSLELQMDDATIVPKWTKIKQAVTRSPPARLSMAMAATDEESEKAILFGGVIDDVPKKQPQQEDSDSDGSEDSEDEAAVQLLNDTWQFDANGSVWTLLDREEKPDHRLLGRYGAHLLWSKKHQYFVLYGGLVEAGDERQFTLNDLWTIALTVNGAQFEPLYDCDVEALEALWCSSSEDESEEEDITEEDEEVVDEEEEDSEADVADRETAKTRQERLQAATDALYAAAKETEMEVELGDDVELHVPRPPESLTAYFRRTLPFWTCKAKESPPMFFAEDTEDEEEDEEEHTSSESELSDSELLECVSKPQLFQKLKKDIVRRPKNIQRHAFVLATERYKELQAFCDAIVLANEAIAAAEKRERKYKKRLLKEKKQKEKEAKKKALKQAKKAAT